VIMGKLHYIYIKLDSDLDKALEIAKYIDVWAEVDSPMSNNRVIRTFEYHKVIYALAVNGINCSQWK